MKKEQSTQKEPRPSMDDLDLLPEDEEEKKGLKKLFSKPEDEEEEPVPAQPTAKIRRYNAKADEGLSTRQVEDRTAKGFVNTTTAKYSKTYRSIFKSNICTFFNLLCLIAGIALVFARAPLTDFGFVLILLANITIGIMQEIRAKLKIDKLTILSAPTATVMRDGRKQDIPVNQIVLDDIILLSAGQQIPADCIAVDGSAEVNESLLTGESILIKKDPGDLLYAGSFVSSGKVAVRVDKLGANTYINRLTARAKRYKRPNSEIINSINLFIKVIGLLIIPVAIAMFIVNYRNISAEALTEHGGFFVKLMTGDPVVSETLKKTAAVIIGMIPSGLILLTTLAMSVGIIRLAKYNTLVQDMYSLEMLARVNVLCLDKTGTITDGRMKVSDCILLNNPTEYTMEDIIGSMLASIGDNNQTSIALMDRFGTSYALQPLFTLPFSSARKLSATTFDEVGTFVLGAPEFVLKPLPVRVEKIIKQYAQMGYRVLLLAHSTGQIQGDKLPSGLKAVSLITLTDNIRPDAIETIKWFRENDVAVKVISGDNPVTVSEVARRAGIQNAARYISLEGLSPLEVETAANDYTVFGRVTPEQKAILIRAIKKAGNTVAMTGDGVNDILAMKEADCAVSVASGSEAARNVSNLVLQDNNFGSMPKIVEEGRRVINNIKNSASLYIMKTFLTLILSIICISLGSAYFFTPQNMLMYELLISALPSFVLSLQPNNSRVKGKFIPFVLSRALPGALTMATGIMTLYIVHKTRFSENFGFIDATGADTVEYQAMMMIALTFTGLVMLYRICQPFKEKPLRIILFTAVAALCVIVISFNGLGEIVFTGWSNLHFTLTQLLLIIIIIQFSFPLSSFLIKACDMLNEAD